MKQRKHQTRGPQFDYFDRREIEVAGILAELVDLIGASGTLQNQFPPTWRAKRRRSVPGGNGIPLKPPTLPASAAEIDQTPAAVSPTTPLSFSPTESEKKTRRSSRKTSKKTNKRKKEDLLQTVSELTQQKESLFEELASMKRSLAQLKAHNTELKARKRELSLRGEKVQTCLETYKRVTLSTEAAQPPLAESAQARQQPLDHASWRPDLIERNYRDPSDPLGISPPSGSGLVGGVVEVGPGWIPDLNVPLEDTGAVHPFRPLDFISDGAARSHELSRAMAAQARRRRMRIYRRTRKSIGAAKIRQEST